MSEAYAIVASNVGDGSAEEQLRLAFRDGEVDTRGSGPRGFIPRIDQMQWRLCTGIVPDEECAVFYPTYYPSEAGVNIDSLLPITLERVEVDAEQLLAIWPRLAISIDSGRPSVNLSRRSSTAACAQYVGQFVVECKAEGKPASQNQLWKKAKGEGKPFSRGTLIAELKKQTRTLPVGKPRSATR